MSCNQCKFFEKHHGWGENDGVCHRFPPVGNSFHHKTETYNWCGEYEKKIDD